MLLLTLLACSDYDLKRDDDVHGETGDPTTAACPDLTFPPEPVDADPECALDPQTGQFYPEIQWHMEDFTEQPGSNYIMATPMVAHITDDDGDGTFGSDGDTPDIAVITYGSANTLRVISGDGSTVHWSAWDDSPQGQSQPAIGDLDGDGDPEIVIATDAGRVVAYHHDGTRAWQTAAFDIGGGLFDGDDADFDEHCTSPAISDMDADGRPEVIVGRVILDGASGGTLGVGSHGIGRASDGAVGTTSFAVDIDLDGEQEVITGDAFYRKDGSLKNLGTEGDGFVAVGNFDSDPEGELVVVRYGEIWLYEHTFERIWGPVSLGAGFGGPPTIADFDGDGEPEIGVASVSLYTVVETDGGILWTRAVQDATSGITGSSVFDFEGDGIAEVVYADETRLWVFNGPDGEVKLESSDHTSNTWLEYPVIADVDADGHAEIILGHNPYQGQTVAYKGITVIADQAETWLNTRQIWNQHAYHITNIEDDATVPADADINWDSYNNFRSGDIYAGSGSAAEDLVPEILDVCEDCVEDKAYVWARARNEGAAEAVGVTLSLYSGPTLLDEQPLELPIAAGMTSPALRFVVNPSEVANLRLTVTGGPECDAENNTDTWSEPACE